MSTLSRAIYFAVSLTISLAAPAQGALAQIAQQKTSATAPAKTATDSFGRETPYGTVFGFLEAAQSGHYGIAAQYLQTVVLQLRAGVGW